MNTLAQLWAAFQSWAMGWGGLAGLLGALALILWFFTPSFLSNDAARAFLLNIGLGCLAFAFVSGYFTKAGFSTCIDTIAKADRAAVLRKEEGIKEIYLCGVDHWDITTGQCMKP